MLAKVLLVVPVPRQAAETVLRVDSAVAIVRREQVVPVARVGVLVEQAVAVRTLLT